MKKQRLTSKEFYERHKNFSYRTFIEYFISPGIRCKFDLIKNQIQTYPFNNALDLGCSGNSFLIHLKDSIHKSFYDIAAFPLKQYLKKPFDISQSAGKADNWHPICGDMTRLPYRENSFDMICALDVLEHVKEDSQAISELSKILKLKGIAIITVPHKLKNYTFQDKLIGHYRRYEMDQLTEKFQKNNLFLLKAFGIYGRLMKISKIQAISPEKTEKNIQKLRERYITNTLFRLIWDIFVKISSYIMKLDAKFHSYKHILNMGFIFIKLNN